jgi:8-oxo-dGTP pyrophosphatase MutT (NUDIX family)
MKTYVITTAIIRDGDKYLIAKRAATKRFAPNEWEFITGFMDEIATAEEIILKELREELSAEGKIEAGSDPFEITDPEGRWIIIPFLVSVAPDTVKINPNDHSEIKWVTLSELGSFEYIKDILEAPSIQSLLNTI